MELKDRDLLSIQAVRDAVRAAKEAQKKLATFSQEQIDRIVRAVAEAGYNNAQRLGKMAHEETGFGRPEHKTIKNQFAAQNVYNYIKDMKTIGMIAEYPEKGICEVAVPLGVVAGIIPSTNPTSTVIYKSLVSLKSGNSIVISPHPAARGCILETAKILAAAAESAGAPKGSIVCLELLTLQGTEALIKHPDIAVILATGGEAMVRAAYSSGNPAIGVGPGNGPAFIERTADIPLAVKRILDSKTFDNGTICASEQSVVVEEVIRDQVIAEFKKQGAYFLSDEEKKKISGILMRANGTMNPAIVGRTPQYIASLCGLTVPSDARVLIGFENEVGDKVPFSKEKLCTVLGFYTEPTWERACERCIEILLHEGAGHTMMIHSQNEAVIREFALKKPVNRLLVNCPGALGGIGATTDLVPALTLGNGAIGGSSTSDNIGPQHLYNLRRMARGMRDIEDIKYLPHFNAGTAPSASVVHNAVKPVYSAPSQPAAPAAVAAPAGQDEEALVNDVVRKVLASLQAGL